MEIGESALAPDSGASPSTSATAVTGTVEISVNVRAVCWDTFADDGREGDRPLVGAEVTLQGGGDPVQTGDDGVARFEQVRVGSAGAVAAKTDYVSARDSVIVRSGTTASTTITLTSAHNECTRPHARAPPGQPLVNHLVPIFWPSEPVMWIARDVLWLLFGLLTVVFMVVGFVAPSAMTGALSFAAAFFAVFAYHTHTIFGLLAGVTTMVLAGAFWLVVGVITILALTGDVALASGAAYGLPPVDVLVYPLVCALWLGFASGLVLGRQPYHPRHLLLPLVVGGLVGGVTALAVFLVLAFASGSSEVADGGLAVLWSILWFVLGAVLGAIGAVFGHVFFNEGNLEAPQWGPDDLLLPCVGERYCLQGNRGWFSHAVADSDTNATREYAYDILTAAGEPVLAAKEGHILQYKEDTHETGDANFVYVRHRDGTIAEYKHLEHGSVTRFNRGFAAMTTGATTRSFGDNPLHCHAGQRLGGCGETGDASTPHIHIAVLEAGPVPSDNFIAFKFADADVGRHGGVCFTMRKYRSDNVDRDAVTIP